MTTRFAVHVLAGLACMTAFCAPPAIADDAAVVSKPAVAGDEKLTQALTRLSTADGFEIHGLDRVGDETVHPPKAGSTVQVLRRMLTGYAYTVELAPADPAVKAPRKLVRISILGRSNGAAGDPAQPALASAQSPLPVTASPQIAGASAAVGGSGAAGAASVAPPDGATPTHPVTRMMHDLAQASIPVVPPAADTSGQSGAASQASGGSTLDPVHNPADMATLTQTATANLNALVKSLKAACPAGAKC